MSEPIDQERMEAFRKRVTAMIPVVIQNTKDRHARWESGQLSISELVKEMECPACDNGITYDDQHCEFCQQGFRIWPEAANALRLLAKREEEGLQRLAEEVLRMQERRERRRQKKAASQQEG